MTRNHSHHSGLANEKNQQARISEHIKYILYVIRQFDKLKHNIDSALNEFIFTKEAKTKKMTYICMNNCV